MKNNSKVKSYQVVQAILYRLKTGCQWRELPMKQFFNKTYSWKSVYYHFQKWCKDESWDSVKQFVFSKYKYRLDLSCIQLDGSHTPSKRGGEAVAYQGKKKCKTTNVLIIADNQGIPLACSEPIAGNHNDAFELEQKTNTMLIDIQKSHIRTEGLFLNADAGFDTTDFRQYCTKMDIAGNIDFNRRNGGFMQYIFDELLYKRRFVIERTNAWLDAFKVLLVRFETNIKHWKALHTIAFTIILLRKL